MLPEVEKFAAAYHAAGDTCAAALAALPEKHDFDMSIGACARCVQGDTAWEVWLNALDAAWGELGTSSDPLVAWTAKHCRSYAAEALMVLKALPAPLEALDAMAAAEDWCPRYDRFRFAAKAAGVLPASAEASER